MFETAQAGPSDGLAENEMKEKSRIFGMNNRGLVIPFIELGTMGVEERIKTRCPCGPCNVRYLFVIQVGILNS